jgi:clan AA aspartic protease
MIMPTRRNDPPSKLHGLTEAEIMGLTHVSVVVRNTTDISKTWEAKFLVDTDATDSMAPASALVEIGIEPVGCREYELADGTELTLDYGLARFDWMGEITAGIILFGPEGTEPILGVTALESAGLVVDPRTQKLKLLKAIPLKTVQPHGQ